MKKYYWLLPNKNNIFSWIMAVTMLIGLFVFHWRGEIIILTYFFETIIIGFIHIFKLFFTFLYSRNAPTDTGKHKISDITYIPFFAFHYFFFIFIQSVFIFLFLSFYVKGIKDSFNVLDNYLFLLSQPDMLLAFISIALMNVAIAFNNFFLPKRYLTKNLEVLFMQPYLRIFIQQFVTILTGFVFIIFKAPIASAVLLIVTRLAVDLALQEASKNKRFKKVVVKVLTKSQNEKELKEVEKQVNAFIDD